MAKPVASKVVNKPTQVKSEANKSSSKKSYGRFYGITLLEEQDSLEGFTEPLGMIKAILNKNQTYNGYYFREV